MLLNIFLFIIILIGLFLLYIHIKSTRRLNQIIDIQTGKPVPIAAGFFTNLLRTLTYKYRKPISNMDRMMDLRQKYGPVFSSYFFRANVNISSPEVIKEVYKKIDEFPKQSQEQLRRTTAGKVIFGDQSIAAINNPGWHPQRIVLNKAFVDNSVFFQPMMKKVNLVLDLWEKDPKGVKIGHDLQKLALDVLATCIFGTEFDTLNGQTAAPLLAYNHTMKNIFNPLHFIFPILSKLPFAANKDLNHYSKIFDKYCWDIIEQTKSKLQEKKKNQINDEKAPFKHLIELMIENGVSDNAIRDNVSIFFLAGHETTATSLSWILSILVTHPDVQEKARKEVLEKVPGELDYNALKELPYLDALIKESLRFYPIVIIPNPRETEKDITLGNIRVPAGTVIQLNLLAMSREPSIWGDPLNIRPERWFPENLTKEQRSASLPFGTGPRVCIGMNFSLLEQKIFLVSLLKRFKHIKLAPNGMVESKKFSPLNSPNYDLLIIHFDK